MPDDALELERLRTREKALEAQVDTLKAAAFVPDQWHCPKCGFVWSRPKATPDAAPGLCPNDAYALVRQSWKARAKEAMAATVEMGTRAEAAEREQQEMVDAINFYDEDVDSHEDAVAQIKRIGPDYAAVMQDCDDARRCIQALLGADTLPIRVEQLAKRDAPGRPADAPLLATWLIEFRKGTIPDGKGTQPNPDLPIFHYLNAEGTLMRVMAHVGMIPLEG